MPMFATLEIDGVIKKKELDVRVVRYKKRVKRVAYSTCELANGLRKRMNELADQQKVRPAPTEAQADSIGSSRPLKKGNGRAKASCNLAVSQGTKDESEREQIVPEPHGEHAAPIHEVSP